MVNENLESYFPACVYIGIENLAEIIMDLTNFHSSTVNLSTRQFERCSAWTRVRLKYYKI